MTGKIISLKMTSIFCLKWNTYTTYEFVCQLFKVLYLRHHIFNV